MEPEKVDILNAVLADENNGGFTIGNPGNPCD
jgi:hypothetical protein